LPRFYHAALGICGRLQPSLLKSRRFGTA
jgi:hypothetical protein